MSSSCLLPPAAAAAAAPAAAARTRVFTQCCCFRQLLNGIPGDRALHQPLTKPLIKSLWIFAVIFLYLFSAAAAAAQNFGRDSAAGALSQRLMRRRRHRVRMSINSGQLQLSLCSVSMSCGFTRLLKCPPSPLFCRLFLLPFRWRATYHFLLSCTNRHDVTRHLPQSPISPLYRQR